MADGSTAGGTATLERAMSNATVAAGRQIKPALEFTGQTYGFAVINNSYQAVMQQGRTWIPVATLPGFIVCDWLVQQGLLPPIGFLANGTGTGHVPSSSSRSSGTQSKIATGNRV